MTVKLNGNSLSVGKTVAVSRKKEEIEISNEALEKVKSSRESLEERIEDGDTIYGVNTGFGDLADQTIDNNQIEKLQQNIIESHSCGVGATLSEEEARALMLLRLNSLLMGNSGVRVKTVQTIKDALNKEIYPFIPRKGSVGASGDLAPLSHMVLALTGRGKVREEDKWVLSRNVLRKNGITPLELKEKEGLALVNGTNFMAALGCLALYDAKKLADAADLAGALALEAMKGIEDAFKEEIHNLRPHEGQKETAENIRELVKHSQLVQYSSDDTRVQNSYSLRCIPQIHGATRDVISFVEEKLETEINSVTDNPLILEDGQVVSGGNFHGQPLALSLDSLKNAVAELANVSERRTAKLVDGNNNFDLPSFLIEDGGLNSGLMIPQYTAASLVSENKVLTHPSSTDSVPTSANQEDHVSMGANSANHLAEVVENTMTVISIEIFSSYQALYHREKSPGKGTSQAIKELNEEINPVDEDRVIRDDFLKVKSMLKKETLTKIV
ncbi:MAG: histidine ammonia-lyase [Nanohaloarchaea archaeon SW_7_43_1]|nr:MAG: histidine ammonia-lyase [Nanohaloarchaea archaeon SW_7_43_1]